MKPFRDLPIQRKLTLVLLVATTTTLLLCSTSMVVWEWFYARDRIIHALTIQARIVAANCSASVAFNDSAAAGELLGAFRVMPNLVAARLRQPGGAVFSQYIAPGRNHYSTPVTIDDGHVFSDHSLLISEPVILDGKKIAALELDFDFTSARREILTPYFAITAVLLCANLLLAFLLSAGLQRVLSAPILRLSALATRVAQRKDYSARAEPGGDDELGRLTLAFNAMLAHIESGDTALRRANTDLAAEMAERIRLDRELFEVSRQAGMAEVANSVLHNVGNALNSVNVSATLVQDQLASSHLRELTRAVTLIRQHASDLGTFISDDPRGRHLPDFIIEIAGVLATEHAGWRHELSALAKNISHIKEIVAAQQSFGQVAGLIEHLSPRSLVEDALRLNRPALERLELTPECDFQPVPELCADKHKILQILLNLLTNAESALKTLPPAQRRLIVSVTTPAAGRIRIAVTDNGVGITPEHLPRIFTHGFTTRPDGHGFGLHAAALAARELEGSLTVHSDGPGLGATFALELPLHPTSPSFHERE